MYIYIYIYIYIYDISRLRVKLANHVSYCQNSKVPLLLLKFEIYCQNTIDIHSIILVKTFNRLPEYYSSPIDLSSADSTGPRYGM